MQELADLRVVELSRTAAAAFAGRLCADAGAEVLLIEPPDGHPLRREGPFCGEESLETSAVHLHVNAGKRSIALDLQAQPEALRRLVVAADIFITDLATAELDPLGLSWTALHGDAPELVMTQVTHFGDSGPYRDYAGTNLTCLALGGQLKITGDPSREPLSNYGAQAEYQGGLSAFAGTVANVLLRDASSADEDMLLRDASGADEDMLRDASSAGEDMLRDADSAGEYLDLSIQDVVATNLEHRGPALNLGLVANRAGLSVSATYGVYPCADGWVYITAFAPALWDRLKAVVELAELEEERFSTQAGRLEHNDELQAILTGWTLSKSSDELRAFAQRGEPLTVTETPERLLDSEQWRGRGVAHMIEHPAAGSIALLGPPWLDAGAPPRPAPALGEGNSEFLSGRSEARP